MRQKYNSIWVTIEKQKKCPQKRKNAKIIQSSAMDITETREQR